MGEPSYVVIFDPDAPSLHGRWYDIANVQRFGVPDGEPGEEMEYTPTGMIDVREDGAVAEIYMRRPESREDG